MLVHIKLRYRYIKGIRQLQRFMNCLSATRCWWNLEQKFQRYFPGISRNSLPTSKQPGCGKTRDTISAATVLLETS